MFHHVSPQLTAFDDVHFPLRCLRFIELEAQDRQGRTDKRAMLEVVVVAARRGGEVGKLPSFRALVFDLPSKSK